MAPNEVLPTRSHYEAKPQRAAEEVEPLPSEAAHQKKTRSKKEKKDKKEKSKKAKKEDKRKKISSKGEDNLILDLVDQSQEKSLETSDAATHVNGINDSSKGKVSNGCIFLYCFLCLSNFFELQEFYHVLYNVSSYLVIF